MRFANRTEAGILLANKLVTRNVDMLNTIVVALPRGGVPVAYEIAKKLNLPLDIILVKKIGAPFNPELAVGAVSEDNEIFYNLDLLKYLGHTPEDIAPYKDRAFDALKKSSSSLRQGRSSLSLTNKDIILVDDGIATGATIEVVVQLLRRRNVKSIIIASPVSSPEAVTKLAKMVEEIVTVITPPTLRAIGQWYDDFTQVETEVVVDLLNSFASREKVLLPIEVDVKDKNLSLPGVVYTAEKIKSWIIFAHGSGSSHKSVRNNSVANEIVKAGHGVLLFDLLTLEEDKNYSNRFKIPLLTSRLLMATKWLKNSKYFQEETPIGYFGASTGSAAAISAAASNLLDGSIYAIVSRGGRPDMVDTTSLRALDIPVLLIVGGDDQEVIKLNEKAQLYLSNSQIYIVSHATHLFEEPGALAEVTRVSINWFNDHLEERVHERKKLISSESELDYMSP